MTTTFPMAGARATELGNCLATINVITTSSLNNSHFLDEL
jgi:hypothetical protein